MSRGLELRRRRTWRPWRAPIRLTQVRVRGRDRMGDAQRGRRAGHRDPRELPQGHGYRRARLLITDMNMPDRPEPGPARPRTRRRPAMTSHTRPKRLLFVGGVYEHGRALDGSAAPHSCDERSVGLRPSAPCLSPGAGRSGLRHPSAHRSAFATRRAIRAPRREVAVASEMPWPNQSRLWRLIRASLARAGREMPVR